MKFLLPLLVLVAMAAGRRRFPAELDTSSDATELDTGALEEHAQEAVSVFRTIDNSETVLQHVKGAPLLLSTRRGPVFRSAVNQDISRKRHIAPCNSSPYRCPYRTYVLYWFYHNSQFCYVPYAWKQRVTYAKCLCKSCRLPVHLAYYVKGRCLPSCYQRRRLFVVCYRPSLGQWRWYYLAKYLPKRCACAASARYLTGEDRVAQSGVAGNH